MGRSKRRAADTSLDRSGDDSGRSMRPKRAKVEEVTKKESGEGTGGGKLMIRCTTCSQQVVTTHPDSVHQHPFLSVLICKKCLAYFRSGEITQDADGLDEQCRWCGDGGNLFGCDYCHNAFCKRCILRNFGRTEIASVEGKGDKEGEGEGGEDHKWKCYVCEPEKLQELRTTCQEVMAILEQRREEAERRKEEAERRKEELEKLRAEREEERLLKELDRRRSQGRRSTGRRAKQISFPTDFCLNPDITDVVVSKLLDATSVLRTLLVDLGTEVDHLEKPATSETEKTEEKMEVEETKKDGAGDEGATGGEATDDSSEKKEEATGGESKPEDAATSKSENLSQEALEKRKLQCTLKMEKGLGAFLKSVNDILSFVPKPAKKAPSAPSTPASSTPAPSTPTAPAKTESEADPEEAEEEEKKEKEAEKESQDDESATSDEPKDKAPVDSVSASEKFDQMVKKSEQAVAVSETQGSKTTEKEEPMDVDKTENVKKDVSENSVSEEKKEGSVHAEKQSTESVPPASEKAASGAEHLQPSQDASERNGQVSEESTRKDQSFESPVKKLAHGDAPVFAADGDKPNGTEGSLVRVTTN